MLWLVLLRTPYYLQAWQQLAKDENVTVDDILANSTVLRPVVLYHVLPTSLSPDELAASRLMDTFWKGRQLFSDPTRRVSRPEVMNAEGRRVCVWEGGGRGKAGGQANGNTEAVKMCPGISDDHSH